ncbi:MAG: oxidoreductase, partial [Proteobacteria bacterium]
MDASNVRLFSPYKIRSVEFKNRFVCSPMCMYSAEDGVPNDWHMVHLGSRAVGGVGLVIVEATSVSPEGRITENDLGIWNDQQSKAFEPIVQFIKKQNCVPGIQLAHAGRKSSIPGNVAPSAVPFAASEKPPRALNEEDLAKITADFVRATERALAAGFQVLEIHMAHGYLLHEFLSPISN